MFSPADFFWNWSIWIWFEKKLVWQNINQRLKFQTISLASWHLFISIIYIWCWHSILVKCACRHLFHYGLLFPLHAYVQHFPHFVDGLVHSTAKKTKMDVMYVKLSGSLAWVEKIFNFLGPQRHIENVLQVIKLIDSCVLSLCGTNKLLKYIPSNNFSGMGNYS